MARTLRARTTENINDEIKRDYPWSEVRCLEYHQGKSPVDSLFVMKGTTFWKRWSGVKRSLQAGREPLIQGKVAPKLTAEIVNQIIVERFPFSCTRCLNYESKSRALFITNGVLSETEWSTVKRSLVRGKEYNPQGDCTLSGLQTRLDQHFTGRTVTDKCRKDKKSYACITCNCGETYEQSFTHLDRGSDGCPNCGHGGTEHGYDRTKPGYFYVFGGNHYLFGDVWKIGITNNTPLHRIGKQAIDQGWQLLHSRRFENGMTPPRIESRLKDELEGFKLQPEFRYSSKRRPDGGCGVILLPNNGDTEVYTMPPAIKQLKQIDHSIILYPTSFDAEMYNQPTTFTRSMAAA